MAESASETLMYILACQICLEDFEETGDHIPRILPCSHTACHKCIGQLIQNKSLTCPECRVKHVAENEKCFPQNKYILANVRWKTNTLEEYTEIEQKCEEHRKELGLYCRNAKCQKTICSLCMLKSHRLHNVVEIQEQGREVLKSSIISVRNYLLTMKEQNSFVKREINADIEAQVKKLEEDKKKMIGRITLSFNLLKKQLSDHRAEIKNYVLERNCTLDDNIALLDTINDTINKPVNGSDIATNHHILSSIKESAQKLTVLNTYWSPLYDDQGALRAYEELRVKLQRKLTWYIKTVDVSVEALQMPKPTGTTVQYDSIVRAKPHHPPYISDMQKS